MDMSEILQRHPWPPFHGHRCSPLGPGPGQGRRRNPSSFSPPPPPADDSGSWRHLLPRFTAATGIEVRSLIFGTGHAVQVARAGDADVLLVHHRPLEEAFVAEGYGVARHDVMVQRLPFGRAGGGPRRHRRPRATRPRPLAKIAINQAAPSFPGPTTAAPTLKERDLWAAAGSYRPMAAPAAGIAKLAPAWAATLNTAAALGAYVLADRATWRVFRNKQDLEILVQGDPRLSNPYSVILVNPARHPHVKAEEGQAFVDWLLSPAGQGAIADFRVGGQQLFYPRADVDGGAS